MYKKTNEIHFHIKSATNRLCVKKSSLQYTADQSFSLDRVFAHIPGDRAAQSDQFGNHQNRGADTQSEKPPTVGHGKTQHRTQSVDPWIHACQNPGGHCEMRPTIVVIVGFRVDFSVCEKAECKETKYTEFL